MPNFFLGIFLFSIAHALPPMGAAPCLGPENGRRQIAFQQEDEFAQIGLNLNASRAIVKVGIGERGGSCSGTFVSDHGHILTAEHCFEHCITRDGFGKTKIHCDISLNGRNTEVEVVYSPPCSYSEAAKQKCKGYKDMILLKAKTPPSDFLCMQLSRTPDALLKENRLISMGYPRGTFRSPERKGDAKGFHDWRLNFSVGSPTKSDYCEVRAIGNSFKGNSKVKNLKVGDMVPLEPSRPWMLEGRIQTTNSINVGASGGPYLDSNQEVVGVTSFFITPGVNHEEQTEFNETVECSGNAFAQPTEDLVDLAEQKGIVLNCKDRLLKSCDWLCNLKGYLQ